MDAVLAKTLLAPAPSGLQGAVRRAIDGVALYHLMSLASAETAPLEVRAAAWERLRRVEGAGKTGTPHLRFAAELIERFRRDPKQIPVPAPPEAPPGQPI